MTLLLKDPTAVLDYVIDWGVDYLDGDDILVESDWSVEPEESGGVEIAGSSIGDRTTTVQASGGTAGRLYRLSNRIVTQSGRTDERSIVLRMEKR